MITLVKCPVITEHAYSAMSNKMGWSRDMTREWVAHTHGHWIPCNAKYLQQHNVKCTGKSNLFFCQVNEGTAIAIIVSDDNAVVTFQDFTRIIAETQIIAT